jgi:plasmid stability protein
MATVTVKNIPEEFITNLKKKAKNNQRSLNGEIIQAMKFYLMRARKLDPEELLKSAKELRARATRQLTIEEIEAAIKSGRE